MIVPMKKVSLIALGSEKENTLKQLRKLGLLHIKIQETVSTRVQELQEQVDELEKALFAVEDKKAKNVVPEEVDEQRALKIAETIAALKDEQRALASEKNSHLLELERLKNWGEVDTEAISYLASNGVELVLCEMKPAEYVKFETEAKVIVLDCVKDAVRFLAVKEEGKEEAFKALEGYEVQLPQMSTAKLKERIEELDKRIQDIDEEVISNAVYAQSMKKAVAALKKQVQFETYVSGMNEEILTGDAGKEPEKGTETEGGKQISVVHFLGYIPAEDIDQLKAAAKENAWGLLIEDPTPEDDVPTKLKNNKFVSLIYPMTDFLGTIPGYFEYDISGWFMGFILIFFGIIFGDGGYGLLIVGVAGALILKAKMAKKDVPPAFLLVALLGGATILWGVLTCTWFGLPAEQIPEFLRNLSLPVISNVNEDKLWYPFWTNGEAGLTTPQNVQILCFTLALIQLNVAHVKAAVRNRKSLVVISEIGNMLQLIGMYYIVLSVVVNGEVFGLSRVIAGIPVGTISIALVAIGFVMSFIFANYEGSIGKSILASVKDIVSVLLGVVNVFSDIVSYIRLWAVGLAGAAISATVNEMAGSLMGNLLFTGFVVFLLVFGHGLNMILNVLSVIVHGVRLNTLEFSTHLGMWWSGHKYQPFEE